MWRVPATAVRLLTPHLRGVRALSTATASTATEKAIAAAQIQQQAQRVPLFAVVHIGGKQYKISENDVIVVNKLAAPLAASISLNKVLMVGSSQFSVFGTPIFEEGSVRVTGTVIEQMKMEKQIVFKMKRRKGFKTRKGHRQDVTLVRINDISITTPIL
eukprot:m.139231 g.139231  ORF g.139231 m.139231 type:complete len:159 (-) comp52551_c0_seq3:210-686(-)